MRLIEPRATGFGATLTVTNQETTTLIPPVLGIENGTSNEPFKPSEMLLSFTNTPPSVIVMAHVISGSGGTPTEMRSMWRLHGTTAVVLIVTLAVLMTSLKSTSNAGMETKAVAVLPSALSGVKKAVPLVDGVMVAGPQLNVIPVATVIVYGFEQVMAWSMAGIEWRRWHW